MTRLRGMTVSAALVAGLMIPAVSLAAPASAMPAAHGPWQTYHDGPFGEIQEDFCDVSGLTVDFSFEDDGAYRYAIRVPPTTSTTTSPSMTATTSTPTWTPGSRSRGWFPAPGRTSGSPTTATAPTRSTRRTRATVPSTPTTANFSPVMRVRSVTRSRSTTTARRATLGRHQTPTPDDRQGRGPQTRRLRGHSRRNRLTGTREAQRRARTSISAALPGVRQTDRVPCPLGMDVAKAVWTRTTQDVGAHRHDRERPQLGM